MLIEGADVAVRSASPPLSRENCHYRACPGHPRSGGGAEGVRGGQQVSPSPRPEHRDGRSLNRVGDRDKPGHDEAWRPSNHYA